MSTPEKLLKDLIAEPNLAPERKVQLAVELARLTKESRSHRHDRQMQRLRRKQTDAIPLPPKAPRPPLGQVAEDALNSFVARSQEQSNESPKRNEEQDDHGPSEQSGS